MRAILPTLLVLLLAAPVAAQSSLVMGYQAPDPEPDVLAKIYLPWTSRKAASPVYGMYSNYWNQRFRPSRYMVFARTESDRYTMIADNDLHGGDVYNLYNEIGIGVALLPGVQATGSVGGTKSFFNPYGEDWVDRPWRASWSIGFHIALPIPLGSRQSFPEVSTTYREWGWSRSVTVDARWWYEFLGNFNGVGSLVATYVGLGYHHHWGDFGNGYTFTSPGNYQDSGFGDMDLVWGAVGMWGGPWAVRVDFRGPGVIGVRLSLEYFT